MNKNFNKLGSSSLSPLEIFPGDKSLGNYWRDGSQFAAKVITRKENRLLKTSLVRISKCLPNNGVCMRESLITKATQ